MCRVPRRISHKEFNMNWDQVEGKWKQLKGQVKERWGKLTDDDLDVIAGKRDQLEGKLQSAYGRTKEQVKKEVDEFVSACDLNASSATTKDTIDRDRMAAEGGSRRV
jgi:uncharacterized protein YjbJ (UPF0337 family)